MSRETSLLVLENEAMYRAMGIERGGQPTRWTGDEAATAGEVQGQAEHARATLEVGSMTGGFVGPGAGAGRGGGGDAGGGKMGDLAAATRTGASGADEESEADDDGELLKDLMAEKSDNKAGDKTPVPSDDRVFAESDRRERETKTKKSPAEAKPATTAPAPDAAMRRPPAKEPFDPFAANRGQRGHYIKRVWFRVGSVTVGALSDGSSAVSLAEQRLGLMPDSRDRRRTLVQALARNGQVDRALAETEAWLARAPGDADALTSLADLTARKGDRKEAIRFLSGITDLAPDNRGYHERLAGAYQRLGDLAHECAHRVALAELAFGDATLVGAGVRCERAAGREAAASRLLLGVVDAKVRTRAEAAAGVPATTSSKKPELALSASWGSSDVDLDVALVAPSGSRISWMGGRKVSGDPASAGVMGRDRLSWPRTSRGSYLVEITRTKAGETTPVAGEVEVTVLGVRRVLPFTLSGERVVIGRIDISNQSKWVTVTDPRSFR